MRFWHGMRVRDFVRLLKRNRFRVHPYRYGMVFTVSLSACCNSVLARLQQLLRGRAIDATEIVEPPIFIVGHWRSGTTLMHELLSRDPRLAFPSTYECCAPHHFAISGRILPKLLWFMAPKQRPMDNMAAGFSHPQEDEFALCALGAPTPYLRIAFPNHPAVWMEMLDMRQAAPDDVKAFEDALLWFVKALTYCKQKRLILKSPPHTGRVAMLSRLFPGAKFVHMVRDPCALFPSTRRTWEALDYTQGFQIPRSDYLDEFVFECLERMYTGFHEQRGALDEGSICDVRYEDLARDPVGEVETVYRKLNLGEFEAVRPALVQYTKQQKDYRPNRHQLSAEKAALIRDRWHGYCNQYGY